MNEQQKEQLLIEAMNEYGTYIKQLIYGITKDYAKTEDILQDVFMKFYLSLDRFRFQSSIKTFLYRIAINECRNYFRSWSYRKLVFKRFLEQEPLENNSVLHTVIAKEEREYSMKILDTLPIKYREILWLYYFAELSTEEIAQTLEISVNTVKTRLARGRQRAKLIIEEESYE